MFSLYEQNTYISYVSRPVMLCFSARNGQTSRYVALNHLKSKNKKSLLSNWSFQDCIFCCIQNAFYLNVFLLYKMHFILNVANPLVNIYKVHKNTSMQTVQVHTFHTEGNSNGVSLGSNM